MIEIKSTLVYDKWFSKLRDVIGRAKIADRVKRLSEGSPGNARNVGSGVFELKIDFGPGYRVYYIQQGQILILLLCGGDKGTQSRDIERA